MSVDLLFTAGDGLDEELKTGGVQNRLFRFSNLLDLNLVVAHSDEDTTRVHRQGAHICARLLCRGRRASWCFELVSAELNGFSSKHLPQLKLSLYAMQPLKAHHLLIKIVIVLVVENPQLRACLELWMPRPRETVIWLERSGGHRSMCGPSYLRAR